MNQQRSISVSSGFTLIEVLIAGVLIVVTMSAIARFTASALTASHVQDVRRGIEDEIMDNMERIQQKDSQLTWEDIEIRGESSDACFGSSDDSQSDQYLGPFIYLADKLDNPNSPYYVPPPNSMGRVGLRREIKPSIDPLRSMTVLIIYRFVKPESFSVNRQDESSDQNLVNEEQRILELNPNYAPRCFQL